MRPRLLALYRRQDETGVSGTGLVADGVEFDDGVAVLRWRSQWPTSVVFHERGMESIEAVHGHGGKTQVVWLSEELETLAEMEQERDLLRAQRAEVLTYCDDASQITGQIGWLRVDAIRAVYAWDRTPPDLDTPEQLAARFQPGVLAAQAAVQQAERKVLEAAIALRNTPPNSDSSGTAHDGEEAT